MRAWDAAPDHRDRPLLDQSPECRDKIVAAAEIDAVAEPNELDIGRGSEKTAERRQRIRALDRVWLRLDPFETHARRRRRLERDVARPFGERDQRNAAMVGFRPRGA